MCYSINALTHLHIKHQHYLLLGVPGYWNEPSIDTEKGTKRCWPASAAAMSSIVPLAVMVTVWAVMSRAVTLTS